MCIAQALALAMLMYYDARPNGMNGLFSHDVSLKPLKTYHVYSAFADLRELGSCAYTEVDGEDLYAVAATNENENAALLTFYNDDIENGEKQVCIEVSGANPCGGCVRAEFYLLSESTDMELVKEEFFTADRFNVRLKIKSYEAYMIKFKQEE
jgi:hypothetical protein